LLEDFEIRKEKGAEKPERRKENYRGYTEFTQT
jgi:hypothetical protein